MRRSIVDRICFDVAVERHQRHIVLIGVVIDQTARKVIDLNTGIDQRDEREIGIIGKRVVLDRVQVI